MASQHVRNPAGTDGFEFLEFAAPDCIQLESLFSSLGFTRTAKHRSRAISLWQQGDITFIINADPDGFAANFVSQHGPCVCGMAFRVSDADQAQRVCLEQDVAAYQEPSHWAARIVPTFSGIGDSLLYLVESGQGQPHYLQQFDFIAQPGKQVGFTYLDHVTHNVYRGNMNEWSAFYERVFNFKEIRYFDIEGKLTGLLSRAMTSPCGKIRIPINESVDDNSQIEEYLREYQGEGIQHIALATDNIYQCIETLRAQGVSFLTIPDTYYENVAKRLPDHGENLARLQANKILIDGNTQQQPKQLLLQIFTETVIGPVFFEVIQRKGDDGFGEGNFQALFDSIELDQIRRGVLEDS